MRNILHQKMFTIFRSILLLLFLSASLPAADEMWTPRRVPVSGAVPFVLYYQQFLRANPFAIEVFQQSPKIEAENKLRYQKSADLYAAMAKAAQQLAESDELSPIAPASIKKDDSKLIKGSWNLYENVPINAADLRQEALYMQYRALSHETFLKPDKINAMHSFAAELEKNADPKSLYQTLQRNVCSRSLLQVRDPLKEYAEKPNTALPDEEEICRKLSAAVQWFVPFVQKYPNEKNMELVDSFLETIEAFHSCYPDSNRLPELTEPLRSVFADIQNRQIAPVIREYAEVYEGVLRRRELLGKPMPIWGADLAGVPIDEKMLADKVVLLYFWATWCGPCVAEFPHLKLLYQKYKEKGFEIVGYSVDTDLEKLSAYLERNPVPWIVLSAKTAQQPGLLPLSHYYGAKSLPVVLLRDRSGKTLLLDARGQKLDEALEKLFE